MVAACESPRSVLTRCVVHALPRYVRCFNRLIKEMNSPEAIYRDAYGNRRRVIKSVFEHEQEVVHMKTSKVNHLCLALSPTAPQSMSFHKSIALQLLRLLNSPHPHDLAP